MNYATTIALGIPLTALLLGVQLRGERVRWRNVYVLLLGVAVAGVCGAKLYSVIERGGFVWRDLGFELRAGYRYPGGIIAIAVSLPLLWRWLYPGVAFAKFADAWAPCFALTMAIERVNCFRRGCCHGTITDLPWATRYGADTEAWHNHLAAGLIPANAEWSAYGHPLQVYFLVAALSLAVFLLWFNRHKRYDGQVALLFVLVDGLEKGVLESYRFAYRPGLQIAAFAMAAVGLAGLVYMASLSRNAAAASISRAG